MEESLAAFRDEAKENRQPEAPGERRFNSGGLDAEIKILPAPGQGRGISLDIPFYRTLQQGRTYSPAGRLGGVEFLLSCWSNAERPETSAGYLSAFVEIQYW